MHHRKSKAKSPPSSSPTHTGAIDRTQSIVSAAACPDYDPSTVRQALERALTPLGGMKAVVSAGQTVLVNPNLLSPRSPDECVTTHPALVAAIVRSCLAAGAARVWVGDSPAGKHSEASLWEKTGVREAVEKAGGRMQSFTGPAKPTACGGRHIPVPAWYDEVDVLISVPKLKTHLLTVLTCALKNVYGMVPGEAKSLFHGDYPSPRSMAAFLVDVFAHFHPALSIVDAVQAMEGDGPANGRPAPVGVVLASRDAVALDACATRLLGLTPDDVAMVRLAAERGLGSADMDRIHLVGDGAKPLRHARLKPARGRILQRFPEWAFRCVTWLLTYRPRIKDSLCVRCGICAATCSRHAITVDESGAYRIQSSACILCMCCLESCPKHAVAVRSPLLALDHFRKAITGRLRKKKERHEPPPHRQTDSSANPDSGPPEH